MKQIRFIASGSNSLIGGFSAGDLARCDDSLAAHLVNEALVAEYAIKAEPTRTEPITAEPEPAKPIRRKVK